MKITSIETRLVAEVPDILWVGLHTDGLVGRCVLGVADEIPVHDTIAPSLVGQNSPRSPKSQASPASRRSV